MGGRWSGAYATMAYYAYKKKNYKRALEQIRKALSIDPDFSRVYYILALILFEKNQKDAAIYECKKCLELRPACKECQDLYNQLLKK